MDKAVRYYGLHFSEGIATFANLEGNGFVPLDEAIKMNDSMSGIPVFINHDEEGEPVGVVVKSFYNKNDGKIWCEFLLYNKEAVELLDKKGWTLSNSYNFLVDETSGHYHGVDYNFIVRDGEYTHLAVVEDPRYAESRILTPEEFKNYNDVLETQTAINSKGVKMFKSIKARVTKNEQENAEKEKAQNEFMETKVKLPKTGKEVTINDLVAEVDARDYAGYEASLEDYIHIDSVKVTIRELLEKLQATAGDISPIEIISEESPIEEVSTENEDDKEDEDAEGKNEDEEKDKKKSENSFFKELKNAENINNKKEVYKPSFTTIRQRAENGRAKYGSK